MSGFIAVHTGAGNCIDESKYQRIIKEACLRASDILKNGGSAMDACEAAIVRLENSGNTNAGFGSNLCWDGGVQCDASIMDGSNMHFGAVTNVSSIRNPISLARRLCDGQSQMLSMERIPPMVMAGAGAEQYAAELGFSLVDPNSMISSKAKFTYNHYKSKSVPLADQQHTSVTNGTNGNGTTAHSNGLVFTAAAAATNEQHSIDEAPAPPPPPPLPLPVQLMDAPLDTVGAVCVDGHGNTAAGSSSGGILLKMPGRVGQAATYGAGCWATDTPDISVATCTTGNGEYLMKTLLAKEICSDLLATDCPVTSLHRTFNTKFLQSPFLADDLDIYGGALTLIYYPRGNSGEVLWSHTTKSFCVGYMSTQQKTPKFVFSPLPTYSRPGKSSVVNGHSFHLRL